MIHFARSDGHTTVELEFKPDLSEVADHWSTFWNRPAELDRPVLLGVVPREGVEPAPRPGSIMARSVTPDAIADAVLAWAETHEFLGDSVPAYTITFGPDHFAFLLGCEMRHLADSPDTTWSIPFVQDWADADISFTPDGWAWQRTMAFVRGLRARLDGRVIVDVAAMSANLDALAAVRGVQNLLMDLATCPEAVLGALEQVARAHEEVMSHLRVELDVEKWGSVTRHGLYGPGLLDIPQSDFSCMISADMFAEFVLPWVRREVDQLDGATYHLDGPDAIRHLEAICSIDGIGVIQWVPGAGNERRDWSDLQRRIDSLGKGQFLGGDAGRLRRYWDEFRSRQVVLCPRVTTRAEFEAVRAAFE